MSEIEVLRKELARLEGRIIDLEEKLRIKETEERAALLQMVAGQERRLGIRKSPERDRAPASMGT